MFTAQQFQIVFTMLWHHLAHLSLPSNRHHLDQFSRFCMAHERDQQTDTQTDQTTPSVAIGHTFTDLNCSKANGFKNRLCCCWTTTLGILTGLFLLDSLKLYPRRKLKQMAFLLTKNTSTYWMEFLCWSHKNVDETLGDFIFHLNWSLV